MNIRNVHCTRLVVLVLIARDTNFDTKDVSSVLVLIALHIAAYFRKAADIAQHKAFNCLIALLRPWWLTKLKFRTRACVHSRKLYTFNKKKMQFRDNNAGFLKNNTYNTQSITNAFSPFILKSVIHITCTMKIAVRIFKHLSLIYYCYLRHE